MEKDILTPMNHREIEYRAKSLSGIEIPDSFDMGKILELKEWLDDTATRVFDDDLVMDYGTDCLKLYLMFENTPRENDAPLYESWNEGALEGMYKFLGRYRRIVLVACNCEVEAAPEVIKKLGDATADTCAKINKYLRRGNTMPNRHNIISALMELVNLFQKELKIGEVVTALHKHEIETAVPNSKQNADMVAGGKPTKNPEIIRLCKDLTGVMSPFATDMSKLLWNELAISEK
jgi:leucyl-tRNA synthetase